jgi:glycosyltransferase involved in cell wall biosynthesis
MRNEMNDQHQRHSTRSAASEREPFSELCQKILVLITEDWFALSHFQPLIGVLREVARDVVVVTRSSGRLGELEAIGVRVIDFDYRRSSSNPLGGAASAWELARILEAEAPDAVHMVSMKPVILGGLALKLVPARHMVVHMTGLGLLGFGTGVLLRAYRAGALRLIGSMLRKPSAFLLVENADDLALLRKKAADPGARFAILGGAGVDPEAYPPLPQPSNDVPIAAFVGRMIRPKGVDVLIEAFDLLKSRGERLQLELCGESDDENPDAIVSQVLEAWCAKSGARWLGYVKDVREVWRRADIFVLPARSREGMPRALLEAAASARPVVVTDIPGSRHFVRDGVEGFIVPPEDAAALADALQKLARDPDLRLRMGEAARLRLMQGFTEAQVKQSLRAAYLSLLGRAHAI